MKNKVGREIQGITGMVRETMQRLEKLEDFEVQEIIFAIPTMETEKKKRTYMIIIRMLDIK